jgi:GT2 family glycosyltransferase
MKTVTAILLSYNCADFAADALRSALAQDCEPMELIVSDDASDDSTFDILREEVERYRGPHEVKLRRRTTNSGSNSAHLNDVFPLASGHVMVSFDGDDISEVSRVRRIVDAFAGDPNVQAVYSGCSLIDEAGRPLGRGKVPHPPADADAREWFARVDAYAAGSTLAVRRTVIDSFGPLDPDIHEDIVLPFRASLMGKVEFIDELLVRYRRRSGSLTADYAQFESVENYRARMLKGIEKARRHLECRVADLQTATKLLPQRVDELARLRKVVFASMADAESTAELVSPSLPTRVRALVRLVRSGAYREDFAQNLCLTFAPRSYLRYKRHTLSGFSKGVTNGQT